MHGSYSVFKHPSRPGIVVVPHPRRDLGTGLVAAIRKQAGIMIRPSLMRSTKAVFLLIQLNLTKLIWLSQRGAPCEPLISMKPRRTCPG
nr:type II toxin-antitoxin system HicA family toxin [Komagataeibacter europaeus]